MDAKERRRQRNHAYYLTHPEKFRPAKPRDVVRAVYILRNSTDKRVYVGESIDVECRWRQHKTTTCKNHPAEDWHYEIFIRVPPLDDRSCSNRMIEHLVITHLIRTGHTLLNRSGTFFFSQWEYVERDVVPYLSRFDEESRAKVIALIRDVYNRDVSPPEGSPGVGVEKMT